MQINNYTCLDCGKEFDNFFTYNERHGLDTPPYERYAICPYCGGAFVNSHICDACGNLITDIYVRMKSGEEFCDACFTLRQIAEN